MAELLKDNNLEQATLENTLTEAEHDELFDDENPNYRNFTIALCYITEGVLNARGRQGMRLMHMAISSSSVHAVRELLRCGADPNAVDTVITPSSSVFQFAVFVASDPDAHPLAIPIVEILLQAGATFEVEAIGDMRIRNKNLLTFLFDYAEQNNIQL